MCPRGPTFKDGGGGGGDDGDDNGDDTDTSGGTRDLVERTQEATSDALSGGGGGDGNETTDTSSGTRDLAERTQQATSDALSGGGGGGGGTADTGGGTRDLVERTQQATEEAVSGGGGGGGGGTTDTGGGTRDLAERTQRATRGAVAGDVEGERRQTPQVPDESRDLVDRTRSATRGAVSGGVEGQPRRDQQPPDIVRGGSDLPPRAVPDDAAQELESRLELAVAEQEIERAGIQNPALRQQILQRTDLDRGEDFRIVRTDEGFRAELTPQFRREQATEQLESQLESQLGADLIPGQDFQVARTDQGFTATLTATGQRKVQATADEEQGFLEGIASSTREDISPLAAAAIPESKEEQARAAEREIVERAERGNLAARIFLGGKAFTVFGGEVQQGVAEATTSPDVEERGPKIGFTVGDEGIERGTVGEQLGTSAGIVAAGIPNLAGGIAQTVGAAGLAAEDVAAGRESPFDLEAGAEATTQTSETFGSLAARRPIEAATFIAAPGLAARARGGGVRARSGARGGGVRGARARGRAEGIRTRLAEEAGQIREFIGEQRGQRSLLEQPARERGRSGGATDLRQMRPREQGPTRRSAGVDVSFGERPGRTGVEGQRSFAERVREFERLKRAPEPDLPAVPRLPAETRTGGVQPTVPAPAVGVDDAEPPGIEEDLGLPQTTQERITQFFEEAGVDQPERRAGAVLEEPGEGTLVEDVQEPGPLSLTEQAEQAQRERERVLEQTQEASPKQSAAASEQVGERERGRERERERTIPATREQERTRSVSERTRTGEGVGVPRETTGIPGPPSIPVPDRPGPGTPGPPGTPAGLLGLGVGPLDAASGRGPAAEPAAEEELLTFGFGAETFSVFGTGQATAPTQAALAAQPFGARAAGALPTAELLNPELREEIASLPVSAGGGGFALGLGGGRGGGGGGDGGAAFDLSLGLELGGGDDDGGLL